MSLFGIGAKKCAKSRKPCQPTSTNSFLLEPILTPSAGIDSGDSLPDLDIIRSNESLLIDLPDVDLEETPSSQKNFLGTEVGIANDSAPFELLPLPISTSLEFDTGVFTVGNSGDVTIDFLFDGGGYQGEVAIFSLDGLEGANLSTEEFIKIAAERALSNSDWGHIVISDATDAAKFTSEFAWEGDFNSGEYQKVRSFSMRAGDRVGFMLVPDGRVEDVLHSPMDGAIRPLFSMASNELNPGQLSYVEQIVDVTGDGNTFAFEDLRVDTGSDRDYNDIVFQVRGAKGEAVHLDQVIDPHRDWRTTDMGQALIAYTEPYITPDPDHDYHEHYHEPTDNLQLEPLTIPIVNEPDGYDFSAADQPLIGVIDTGINGNNPYLNYNQIINGFDWVGGDSDSQLQPLEGNEHGTHIVGTISSINDDATIWVGRAVGSGQWADSLIEFVDTAKASGQPNAVANLSFELAQINWDETISPRYELTEAEWRALDYAHRNNIIIVAAAGNDGSAISALGQASQLFDNIITVGSATQVDSFQSIANGFDRTDYSNYGASLSLVADGGTPDNPMLAPVEDGIGAMSGTSVAAAKVTGAVSQVWAANPQLSYQQVIEILKLTAVDLTATNWDAETGAGLLNIAAAVHLAKATTPVAVLPKSATLPDFWAEANTVIEKAANVTEVTFNGTVISTIGANVRSGPSTSFAIVGSRTSGAMVSFDGWTVGELIDYSNEGLGRSDRWYRIAGTNQWISAAIIAGAPPESSPDPLPESIVVNGFTISNPFLPVWRQYQSTLLNPISNAIFHAPSGATYQLFQGGSIVTSHFGTFPLYGGIRQTYLREGGLNGWMGAPKSAEYSWEGKIRQDFANGYIVWNGRSATAYRNGSNNPNPGQPTPIDPGKFYNPLSGSWYTVVRGGGYRDPARPNHVGIDLATGKNEPPVKAAKGGRIVRAGWDTTGYGNLIVIEHDGGIRTYYAHLSHIAVNVGDTVSAGQYIGNVGTTGNSTGNHLHFEVRVSPFQFQRDNRNPADYIQF